MTRHQILLAMVLIGGVGLLIALLWRRSRWLRESPRENRQKRQAFLRSTSSVRYLGHLDKFPGAFRITPPVAETLFATWGVEFAQVLDASRQFAQQEGAADGGWLQYGEAMRRRFPWMDGITLARAWFLTNPLPLPAEKGLFPGRVRYHAAADSGGAIDIITTLESYEDDDGILRYASGRVLYLVNVTMHHEMPTGISFVERDITRIDGEVDNPTQQHISHDVRHALRPLGITVNAIWEGLRRDRLYPDEIVGG